MSSSSCQNKDTKNKRLQAEAVPAGRGEVLLVVWPDASPFFGFYPWINPDFIHQRDLESRAPDHSIGEYACNNTLTILAKHRDFSDRILLSNLPPRIIHSEIRSLRLRDFHTFISEHWKENFRMSQTHQLV